VILLKNDEVIDLLTSPPTDFSALKMFKLKCYLIFNKTVYDKIIHLCQTDAKIDS